MKDLLRGQGKPRLPKREYLKWSAFFVPHIIRHLVNLYCEVLLADATQKPNCSGYILWHVVVVDDSELRWSTFHALLSDESGATSRRAINDMKDMMPPNGHVGVSM